MPTFGGTTQGGSSAAAGINYIQVFGAGTGVGGFVCPEAGTVSKLSTWCLGNGSNQAWKPVIYADSAGAPGALLASGPEVVVSGSTPANTLVDFPLTTPLAVTATTYWLGFHFGATDNGVKFYFGSVGGGRKYKTVSYASGPSDPYGTPDNTDTTRCTVYATYTTAGPTTHFGAASLDLTDTITVAAKKNAKGAVALPLAFSAAVQAKRNAKGSVTLPLTFNINVGATIIADIVPAAVTVTSVTGPVVTIQDEEP